MPRQGNWRRGPTLDDAYARFTKLDGECLIWQRSKNTWGYGHLQHAGKMRVAHRVFYEHFVGPIPPGAMLHHVCLRPACVNPAHLIPVANMAEHIAMEPRHAKHKTHCPKGHAYTPENTKRVFTPGSNGKRYWKRACRACHLATGSRRRAELHARQPRCLQGHAYTAATTIQHVVRANGTTFWRRICGVCFRLGNKKIKAACKRRHQRPQPSAG